MACGCDFKKSSFGKEVYCKKCGMDLGLNPVKRRIKEHVEYYCCDGCLKEKK